MRCLPCCCRLQHFVACCSRAFLGRSGLQIMWKCCCSGKRAAYDNTRRTQTNTSAVGEYGACTMDYHMEGVGCSHFWLAFLLLLAPGGPQPPPAPRGLEPPLAPWGPEPPQTCLAPGGPEPSLVAELFARILCRVEEPGQQQPPRVWLRPATPSDPNEAAKPVCLVLAGTSKPVSLYRCSGARLVLSSYPNQESIYHLY